MPYDLILQGNAYVNGELGYAEIGIENGKIAKVSKSIPGACRRIDAGRSIILPGFTDPHVHFRDPGMTHKEDFGTGSLSALHGGLTCVLDMPNTVPPATDVWTLAAKKTAIRGRSFTDYGLFAAVTKDCNPAVLAPFVAGFKLFMGSTTGDILLNHDADMIPAVRRVLKTGKRMSVHAEDDSMILRGEERCTSDHSANRPEEAEYNAVSRLSAEFGGCRINICHVTSPRVLDLAAESGFTTEATLHHLLFDTCRNTGAEYKVNPPVRDPEMRSALYKEFLAGKITMLGSDHAPHTAEEKSRPFSEAPSGIPGAETTVPVVMDMVRTGAIPLSLAVSMGAENPASAFSVKKGKIQEGFDADFALFDMHEAAVIDPGRLHSRCGHSPYGGFSAVFPDTVMIRGETQISGREFCGEALGRDICG